MEDIHTMRVNNLLVLYPADDNSKKKKVIAGIPCIAYKGGFLGDRGGDMTDMRFYSAAEEKILKMYAEKHLSVRHDDSTNSVCKECKKSCDQKGVELKGAISAYCVGKNFYKNPYRVLFVGKTARDNPGSVEAHCYNTFTVSRDGLWHVSWPYWCYTRLICQNVFGNDSIENIAFTNMVKCNISSTTDKNTKEMNDLCITQLEIIKEEIKIIKPTKIIFYTARDYDGYIQNLFDDFTVKVDGQCQIGRKNMPWLEAASKADGIRILRVGHPERLKKVDFTDKISAWIKS